MQNTYRLISITFLILLYLFSGMASAEEQHVSKPNIIFIMADDLGKNILSLSGIKNIIKMPKSRPSCRRRGGVQECLCNTALFFHTSKTGEWSFFIEYGGVWESISKW